MIKIDNDRMQQLIFMFSKITGMTADESKKIILQTNTGKAVNVNNSAIMYEQQTENLYGIMLELKSIQKYHKVAQLLSDDNIIWAMKELKNAEKQKKNDKTHTLKYIARKPELKNKEKNQLLSARKRMLQIQRQNQINAGRVEYANKVKR